MNSLAKETRKQEKVKSFAGNACYRKGCYKLDQAVKTSLLKHDHEAFIDPAFNAGEKSNIVGAHVVTFSVRRAPQRHDIISYPLAS